MILCCLKPAHRAITPDSYCVNVRDQHGLSARQLEVVLHYVGSSGSVPQVAHDLSISVKTVGVHLNNVMHQLRITWRGDLVHWVLYHKLIKPFDPVRRPDD